MKWIDGDEVMAMAYDYPVPGFKNNTVNTLRLWAAKSSREFDLEFFNSGDYIRAVQDKNSSENISKVLYPSDQYAAGKELRLKQQYFFVSATLKDIVRRYKKFHQSYNEFPDSVAIQLNDTHPSVAIPELMRIFVDHDGLNWDDAWKITSKTFGYTNHTVLPEALETWTEGLFGYLLPRHLQIVQEIDRRFLVQVTEMFPGDKERKNRVAIISGNGERVVNMARLAIVGSHSVNGVSMLHSDILKQNLFRDFFEMMPEKFKNVTNGITPRRWLLQSNPQLSRLIMDALGDKWATDLEELKNLEAFVEDKEFCKEFRLIKEANKDALSDYIFKAYWISFPSEYLLDCQTKRFHEYKRQLLNILHVVTMYNRIKEGRADKNITPRTVLFSGKSAPSYFMCKLIIKLIHSISAAIDADPSVSDRLRVIFVPNYDVSIAQRIMPVSYTHLTLPTIYSV